MKIRKLTITGFRSFTGTTEIRFENGLAGIRGLTEREKIDLADAVSFLMGTSTPTRTEAAYYSEEEPEAGKALTEVSMEVLNSDEVGGEGGKRVFARRMTPSGSADFYVNDAACSPERYDKLLSEFNAGRYGFSLIDRNVLFDLAGNRNQSLGKMIHAAAGTGAILKEIQDLREKISEEKQRHQELSRLYEEAEEKRRVLAEEAFREQEYRALQDTYQKNEQNLLLRMIHRLERNEQNLTITVEDIDRRLLELKKEKETARARVLGILKQLTEADEESVSAEEQKAETLLEMTGRQHRIGLLDAEIAHQREKMLSLSRDRDQEQLFEEQLEREIISLEQEIEETDRSRRESDTRIRDDSRSLDESRDSCDQMEKEFLSLNDALFQSEKDYSLEEAGLNSLKELLTRAEDRKLFLEAELDSVSVSRMETALEEERKQYLADQKAFESEEIRNRRAEEQALHLTNAKKKLQKSLALNEKALTDASSRENFQAYRTERVQLERERRLLDKEREKLEREQEAVHSVITETGKRMDQLHFSMDAGKIRIEQMTIRISEERKRLNRIQEELSRVEEEVDLFRARLADAARRTEELKADSFRIRQMLDPMNEPANEWNAVITQHEQKIREDEIKLAEAKTRGEVLRARRDEKRRYTAGIKKRIRVLERIMNEEQENARSIEMERAGAEAAARSLESILESRSDLVNRRRSGKAGIISELRKTLEDYEILLQRMRSLQTEKGIALARVRQFGEERADLAEFVFDRFDTDVKKLSSSEQHAVFSFQEVMKESRYLRNSMRNMGNINFRASEELEEEERRSRELLEQRTALTAVLQTLRKEASKKEQTCRISFRAALEKMNAQLRTLSAENPAAFSAEIRTDSREDLLQSDWYVHIKKHDGDSGERMDCLSPSETGSVLSVLLEAAVRAGGSGLFVMTGLEQFLTETELSDFCRRFSGSGKTGLLISETGGTEHSGNHYYMNPSAGTAEADCTENGE